MIIITNAWITCCFSIPSLASSMIFSTSSIEKSFCTSFSDSFPTFKLSSTCISTWVNSKSWTSCSTRSSCLSVLSINCSWYRFFFKSNFALLINRVKLNNSSIAENLPTLFCFPLTIFELILYLFQWLALSFFGTALTCLFAVLIAVNKQMLGMIMRVNHYLRIKYNIPKQPCPVQWYVSLWFFYQINYPY